jgi:hypothetical protein
VRLLDGNGNQVDSTTTDTSGSYVFYVTPGDYHVEFDVPTNYFITLQNQGSDEALDSDIDDATGRTDLLTVGSGDELENVDGGLVYELATISGRTWNDADEDGIRDEGETVYAGATVELMDSTGATVLDWTTTDNDGVYRFEAAAGDYRVRFQAPASMTFTPQGQGGDEEDSDAGPGTGQTASFSVAWDQDAEHLDAGFVSFYGSISGNVFLDNDGSGTRNSGDVPSSSFTVRLLNASFNEVGSTTPDSNGVYTFTDLTPGDYHVEVVAALPYVFTAQDSGSDDTADSDIDPTFGQTDVIALGANQDLAHIDAGLLPPGTVSGQVFEDTDQDGVRDGGESGVADVWVYLYDGTSALIASVQTDGTGAYSFAGLVPAGANYYMQFAPPGSPTFTVQDAGSDDTVDSDVDSGGVSDLFWVGAGQLLEHLDAGIIV